MQHFDVMIIGAGLAGIGTSCHLQKAFPNKSLAIIEMRERMGGTWDLFRYPGVRSDSNMHVLGYKFRPWVDEKAIAPGEKILDYIRDTAREHNLMDKIHYGLKLVSADFNRDQALWTVTLEDKDGKQSQMSASWLQSCGGYYRYDAGYRPDFPNEKAFKGEILHPQFWPQDLDVSGKRFAVIGSGATAITLVPALAKAGAKHVTMVQRSPTYIFPAPETDRIGIVLNKLLPASWAYKLIRKKNIFLERYGYQRATGKPAKTRKMFEDKARKALPKGFPVEEHFRPAYNPGEQRICLSPDGDFYAAIKDGKAEVETGNIKRFTASGLEMESGAKVESDYIVTATGLIIQLLGGAQLSVDGEPIDLAETYIYKGCMLSGVPNSAMSSGTLTASYTLRVELQAEYICRVMKDMERRGADVMEPYLSDEEKAAMPRLPFMGEFNSGYVVRAIEQSPRQGGEMPWVNPQLYLDNVAMFKLPVDDGVLRFEKVDELQAAE